MQLNRKNVRLTLVSALVIFMMSCASTESAIISADEIADAIATKGPFRFCGRTLTTAIRFLCLPAMRAMIRKDAAENPYVRTSKLNAKIYLSFFKFHLLQRLTTWTQANMMFTSIITICHF